jgi:hypothetical protein
MFGKKIKVSDELMERLKQASSLMGCSSVDEFAEKILMAETEKILAAPISSAAPGQQEVEAITRKLKGLGYLE